MPISGITHKIPVLKARRKISIATSVALIFESDRQQ